MVLFEFRLSLKTCSLCELIFDLVTVFLLLVHALVLSLFSVIFYYTAGIMVRIWILGHVLC